jgi:Ni,Fe-hydrogenase III large subunit
MDEYIKIKNNRTISLDEIPILLYPEFLNTNAGLLDEDYNHCVNYFGFPENNKLRLICCIANDKENIIYVSSSIIETGSNKLFESFSSQDLAFSKFEREIHENFGIQYKDHPWLKPVRYPFNRFNPNSEIANYPFYVIKSEDLHEVGVGPIHAGIIEPGHFRFICNGEKILHLEIQLGYQHRGIEDLFIKKHNLNQRQTLAESIAGDTTVGHSVCFSNLWESLSDITIDKDLHFNRTVALEIERIAMHSVDLSALCGDIAYQIGNAVFSRLRTPIINFFQTWCGNRLAKGLVTCGKNNYPFNNELRDTLLIVLEKYENDFMIVNELISNRPSALSRFEKTGVVTRDQALSIGAVGMAARASGLFRDIRSTHPHNNYKDIQHQPIIKRHGDVYSRTQIRRNEIIQSIGYIREMLNNIPQNITSPETISAKPNAFTISLVEGWRGEICHCAITGKDGNLAMYKIKDPSFHNWMALALSVRKNEISDFPICNKSFNLSYCGNDL